MTDRIAKTAAAEEYAAQIDEWVRQLSQPIPDEAGISSGVAGIDSRSLASEVRDFANECFDKRVEKILAFCPLTSWGTIPLREQVDRFLRETNSTAAESSRQGALRFLNWLEWECPLEPEDADRVACDCGWLLVEEKARLRRNDYLLFQERRLTNPFLIAGEDDWLRFRFLADPTRVDLVLVSSLFLEGKSLPPATATLHAHNEQARVLLLDPALRRLVSTIEGHPGITGESLLATHGRSNPEPLIARLNQLADQGLLAVL